jgi:hypothetical protein
MIPTAIKQSKYCNLSKQLATYILSLQGANQERSDYKNLTDIKTVHLSARDHEPMFRLFINLL